MPCVDTLQSDTLSHCVCVYIYVCVCVCVCIVPGAVRVVLAEGVGNLAARYAGKLHYAVPRLQQVLHCRAPVAGFAAQISGVYYLCMYSQS